MCTGAEITPWLIGAGAAATGAAAYSSYDQKKEMREDGKRAIRERETAQTTATQNAYAKNAMARRALRENSLFTGGASSGGRQTLGV